MPGVRVREVDLSGRGLGSQGSAGVKTSIKDLTTGAPAKGAPKIEVTERDQTKK
jgi:hypothetical protein